jgi:flagellin
MVTSVNTNVNALAAVQALTDISNQLTSTQAAISSGLKVGQASDNPAVFTIAQGLRANVNALTAVSDSLATGTATLQAQTQGATSISNALTTLLQTVTQGQGETGAALAATNATIKNALSNIDAYAKDSTINGVNLLGTASTLNVLSAVDGTNTTITTSSASTSAGLGLSGLSITTGGTTLTPTTTAPANADVVSYVDSSGNTTDFEFTDGTAPLTSQPNSTTKVIGVTVGATASESIGNLLSAFQQNGVAASEDSSGVITVSGGTTTTSAASLTQGTVSGGASAISAVNAAIAKIGATLSQFGAATLQLQGLSTFTSSLQDSTTTSLGAIVDANLSSESAQLSSLQTKQSLAIQSLSLANQGPSALLQLFR